MNLSRNRLAFVLVAGAMLPAAMYAQQSTGSLSGHITIGSGESPKAGVTVTAVQKGTNLTRRVVSDAEGNWRIPALPVGDYRITLSAGTQNQVLNRSVNLGMDQSIRYKWPAEASAIVEVIAAASGVDQVNTTSAEVGVNVDSTSLMNMPITDRNVNSAAVLAPGVQIIQGSQVDPTKKTSTYIVSGDGQGRGTNFNVDGADNNSSDVGGYVMPVPFDAIDQFQVVTNQYKAEFGRSNAGFLNVVTKSGGNEVTGVGNFQWTDQNMRARNTDESPKLANDSKVYSLMTSGPIIKDRLFYMVAGERTMSTVGETMDPRAIAAIPALGSESTQTKKMNLYAKLDWNVNQMWLASFKYARYYDQSANQTFPQAAAVANYVDPSMLGTNRDDTTSYGAKLTGNFGNVVWESTINHFNYTNNIRPSTPGQGMGSGAEVRPRFLPNASDTWYSGQDPNSYQNTGVERGQWKNEITWTLPEHNIKGGFDYQKTDYPIEKYFWANPGLYVIGVDGRSTTATGVSFANAWSSTVTQADVSRAYLTVPIENPPTSFKGYGIYLQDDWTVNNRWNVYYGYRIDWDTQLDYYSQFDTMYAQIHAANPMLAGIGSEAPRTHKYGSPRIQVLYKPNGDDNLTFKFGAGKFVASTIDNVVGFSRALNAPVNGMPVGYVYNTNGPKYAGQGPSASFTSGSLLTTVNGHDIYLPADLTPYNYANNVNGLQTLFTQTIAGYLTTANFNTGGKELLASNFAYPTTQTLSFGMTYKFSERSAIDLTLLYSKTKNLTLQFTTDGSAPQVWSPNPGYAGTPWSAASYNNPPNPNYPTYDQGDSIFLSNQTSSSRQLQAKYTFTTSNFSLLATFVYKNVTSSNGGDAGAFTNGGNADFYGSGVNQVWSTGAERKAQGTEPYSGSFSVNYRWDEGTKISFLGQWHSGKYYDVFLGGDAANNATVASPNPVIGQRTGAWNLDLGFRASQDIKVGPKFHIEPYLSIQNLLNNYDYGTNYQNSSLNGDNSVNTQLGQRFANFQTNSPRTLAVGVRLAF
jgi:hypothetical protein